MKTFKVVKYWEQEFNATMTAVAFIFLLLMALAVSISYQSQKNSDKKTGLETALGYEINRPLTQIDFGMGVFSDQKDFYLKKEPDTHVAKIIDFSPEGINDFEQYRFYYTNNDVKYVTKVEGYKTFESIEECLVFARYYLKEKSNQLNITKWHQNLIFHSGWHLESECTFPEDKGSSILIMSNYHEKIYLDNLSLAQL